MTMVSPSLIPHVVVLIVARLGPKEGVRDCRGVDYNPVAPFRDDLPPGDPHPCGQRLMPLFEIETDSHIIITWAQDDAAARTVAVDAYPYDAIRRVTRRPRDSWVISKGALGVAGASIDICGVARDCLSKSSGDKLQAIRLYMAETGADLEKARRVIESNMVMGW